MRHRAGRAVLGPPKVDIGRRRARPRNLQSLHRHRSIARKAMLLPDDITNAQTVPEFPQADSNKHG
jgi:hypothetical protein